MKTPFITLFLTFSFCSCLHTYAQLGSDLINMKYTYIGEGKAKTQNSTSFYKYHLSFMIPQRVKNSPLILFHKLKLEKLKIHYGIQIPTPNELKIFSTICYSFGFTRPLKNNWNITAFFQPGFSSNLETPIELQDIRLLGMGFFLNQKIGKFLKINLDTGYTFRRIFEFADQTESVVSFNLKNNAFVQMGVGIGL